MKTIQTLILAALFLFAPALHAGTFTTAAWTDDASSGIVSGQTSWAYHFGSAALPHPTVNGVTVTGLAGAPPPAQAGQFSLKGPNFTIPSDTNDVTALGGTGSAVIASSFIYNADPTATLTIEGLTAGLSYTVTMLSCGWNVNGEPHEHTFTSGGDTFVADFNSGGLNKGFRVDYTFTADAATRLITLTRTNASQCTWHFYGLALRPISFVVTNNNDTRPGSLRQTLADAAANPGANTITFATALNGECRPV